MTDGLASAVTLHRHFEGQTPIRKSSLTPYFTGSPSRSPALPDPFYSGSAPAAFSTFPIMGDSAFTCSSTCSGVLWTVKMPRLA